MKNIIIDNPVNKPVIIKKHSSLIQTNNITTLQQRKAFNVMIYTARQELKENPDLRLFTIDLHQLRQLAGLKDTNIKNIKEALKVMQDLKIEYNVLWKDKETRESIVILPMVRIETEKNNSLLTFEFPTDILERIKDPKMYANLDLIIVKDLSSKYSLALYELLKDYLNLGTFKINVDDLKKTLGADKNKGYNIFTSFNRRVLTPAIKEINEKTDINASFKGIKKGTTFTDIIFTISLKKNSVALIDNLTIDLQQLGFTDDEIKEIRKEKDDDYIKENIEKAKQEYKSGKIKNLKWYVITALRNDYRNVKTEYEKQQEKEQEERKEQQRIREQEEIKQKETERKAKEEKQEETRKEIEKRGATFKEKMETLYKESVRENTIIRTQLQRVWIESPLINGLFLDFVYNYLQEHKDE